MSMGCCMLLMHHTRSQKWHTRLHAAGYIIFQSSELELLATVGAMRLPTGMLSV